MATIASIALKLTASPQGLIAGLNVAKAAIASAADASASFLGEIVSYTNAIGSSLAQGDIFGALRTGIVASEHVLGRLVKKIPFIGEFMEKAVGVAVAALETLVEWTEKALELFKQGAEKIHQWQSAAEKMGTGFQEAGALALAFGGDADKATKAMLHMNKTIQAARTGDESAKGLIQGQLGLDPEKLAKMGTGERLEAMKKSLHGMGDQLSKSSALAGVFGDKAAAAVGHVLGSAKGLDKFRDKVKRFGMDLGEATAGGAGEMAEQVHAALKAIEDASLAYEGLKMNIAAGLAPVLLELSAQFEQNGVDAKKVQEIVVTTAKIIAYGGAIGIEAWKGLGIVWDTLCIGLKVMGASVLKAVGLIGKGVTILKRTFVIAWKAMGVGAAETIARLLEVAAKLPNVLGGSWFRDAAAGVREDANRLRKDMDNTAGHLFDNLENGASAMSARLFEQAKQDRRQFWAGWAGDKSAIQSVNEFFDNVDKRIEETKKHGKKAKETGHDAGLTERLAKEKKTIDSIINSSTPTLTIYDDYRMKVNQLQAAMKANAISAYAMGQALNKVNEAFQKTEASKAAEVMRANLTPLQTFKASLSELNQLLQRGKIDLQTYQRAAAEAVMALHQGDKFKLGEETDLDKFNERMQELNQLAQTGTVRWQYLHRAIGSAIMELDKADKFKLGEETGAEEFARHIQKLNALLKSGNITLETYRRAYGTAVMDMHSKGDKFKLGLETPLEKLQDRLAELNQLLDAGSIRWDTYVRGVHQAGKSFIDLNKASQMKMPSATEFGSQEAYASVARASQGGRQHNIQEQLRDAVKAQLEVQRRQAADMHALAIAARKGNVIVG